MCNPYDKREVITSRSKIPVPKESTNHGKSAIHGVAEAPVRATQAPTGLPAGLFGQQAKLANFKIPKLNRSTCNSTSNSTANSTTESRNLSVSCKTPSKLLTAESTRKPTTYLPKVIQKFSQQPKRNIISLPLTPNTMSQKQNLNPVSPPPPLLLQKSLNMFIKGRDLGRMASLHVRGMRLSGATQLILVHMLRGSGVMTWWEQPPRPMAWPDMSDMGGSPNIPKGIFELRSVEPCAVPSEISSIEGTKKIQMIAFHLISSGLAMVKVVDYLHIKLRQKHHNKPQTTVHS